MIRLTRLNHGPFLVNPDLIEHLEMAPDTVVALTTGHSFMVRESPDEVVQRIIEFRRKTYETMCWCPNVRGNAHENGPDSEEGCGN